jgi:hypothetical protein
MTQGEIAELKQLLELQREMTRQRLRTATCEAWVDDLQQKMGINRAVYAAGYGIAPTPSTEASSTAASEPPSVSQTVTLPPAAAVTSTAAKFAPYLLVAASLAGGGGIGAAIVHALGSAADPAATATPIDFPVYDVQRWKPQ